MKISVIAATGIVLVACAASGAELNLPHHKPGLWQNDITVGSAHSSNLQCFDVDSEVKMVALSRQHCSEHRVMHNPNGSWTTIGTCQFMAGVTKKSSSEISGDFNSKLTIVTNTEAATTTQASITSTWLGPCKPDQHGGDVITSSGAKVNVIDMMSSHPAPAH